MKKISFFLSLLFILNISSCAKGKKIEKKKEVQTKQVQTKQAHPKQTRALKVLPKNYEKSIKESVGEIKHKTTALIFVKKGDKESEIATSLFHDLNIFLGDSIQYKEIDNGNKEMIKKYNIKYFPTIVMLDYKNKDHGVYFIGSPQGYELSSVLAVISFFVRDTPKLPDDIASAVKLINKPLKIEVLVSSHCKYCPNAAISAHAIAYLNNNIKAYNIDASQAPDLAQKYNVSSVPLIVYQGGMAKDLGAVPLKKMLSSISIVLK